MKEIRAYVRPTRIEAVVDALNEAGISGMTIIHVQAIGEACDPENEKLSMELARRFAQVVKVEIICLDEEAPRFAQLICDCGHTGAKGDGMVFISPIDEAVSIRTGIRGEASLENPSGR